MASIIKADTLQSTTANVFVLNSSGTEYARFDSTGVFQLANPTTFPAGTAALPSITATGDTNTGLYFPAADTIAFTKGGAEAMRIDSSGNVGIGTTAPASKMEIRQSTGGSVVNALTLSNYVGASVGTGVALHFDPNGAGGLARTASIQSIQSTSGNFADLRFFVCPSATPTEAMRIDSAGLVTIASGQIKFPATQSASSDANTLDDYEEGTWTPVIIGTSTAGTGTYSSQIGRYTKIGNRVYFGVYCVWSAHTGTGDMTMGGLPFTSSGSNFTGVSIRYSNLTCSAGYICTPIVADNRSDIVFQQSAVGAAATALGQGLDVSADVIMAGHYFIT